MAENGEKRMIVQNERIKTRKFLAQLPEPVRLHENAQWRNKIYKWARPKRNHKERKAMLFEINNVPSSFKSIVDYCNRSSHHAYEL